MKEKIFTLLQKKSKLSSFVLGLVSALAFPPLYALYLFVLALCLMFKLTDLCTSYKQVILKSYWFGFGFFVAGLYWIGNALLVDIVNLGWLYPLTLLAIGGFFGLFMIPPFAVWYYFKKNNIWYKIIAFACVWVLAEWVRSFIFTGFPWNLLGTVFAFNDIFIQSACLWGTYGLSFIFLILSASIYALFEGNKKSSLIIICITVLFLTIFGLVRIKNYNTQNSDIKIRLVQPSIAQSMKWNKNELENNFYKYIELSKQEPLNDVDFVVWGETALPFDIEYNEKYRERIKEAIPDSGYLITGLVRYDIINGKYEAFNSMYVIDKNAQIVAFYDKNHLVPFGEYIPLRKYLPDWIRPIANNIADFSTSEKLKNIKIKNYPKFGALICYEIIFPDEVVNRQDKPDWLVVLTNDGWYGKSSGPYQHLVSAKMRAIEEGISIVRSANSGISAVINPLGKISQQIELNKIGAQDIYLPLNSKIFTLYSLYGKNAVLLLMLLILVAILHTTRGCK